MIVRLHMEDAYDLFVSVPPDSKRPIRAAIDIAASFDWKVEAILSAEVQTRSKSIIGALLLPVILN